MGTRSKRPPGPLSVQVAAILKDEMTAQRWSQTRLERESGISQSQISKYFRAERSMNLDELDAFCRALGLRVSAVMFEADRRR